MIPLAGNYRLRPIRSNHQNEPKTPGFEIQIRQSFWPPLWTNQNSSSTWVLAEKVSDGRDQLFRLYRLGQGGIRPHQHLPPKAPEAAMIFRLPQSAIPSPTTGSFQRDFNRPLLAGQDSGNLGQMAVERTHRMSGAKGGYEDDAGDAKAL